MKTASYTCHKCHVEFPTRAIAVKHYGEKWHQYNLMRLLKNLTPISQENYEELMSKSTFLQEAKNRINVISCNACKKNFTSQGSFETHQRSRKHKQNVVRKAAENVRRLQIQKQKDIERRTKSVTVMAVEGEAAEKSEGPAAAAAGQEETAAVPKGSQYCTACKAAFASEKDFKNHALTLKHQTALKAAQLSEERQQELDKQDDVHATGNDDEDDMEVEEVDSDEWEEEDAAQVMEQEKNDTKVLPLSVCLFCSKKSANLMDNLGHMERQHSFIVPHQEAGDLEKLQNYLGEKVGNLHQCLECSKEFQSLRACRLHMLDKPHLAIRFEGEYDAFFDVSKILADIQLPYKPAENEIFAFPLRDGTFLTHRDLKRYFNQRLQPTAYGIKRLQGPGIKAITHLGKRSSETKTVLAIKKTNERRVRDLNIMHKIKDKKRLGVSTRANKLQAHFRPQVINAG